MSSSGLFLKLLLLQLLLSFTTGSVFPWFLFSWDRKCRTRACIRKNRSFQETALNALHRRYQKGAQHGNSTLTTNATVITVPVCIHDILSDDDQIGGMSSQMLQQQIDTLNQAFKSSFIQFAWAKLKDDRVVPGATVAYASSPGACRTSTRNQAWFMMGALGRRFRINRMRVALRKGGPTVLNLYWTGMKLSEGHCNQPWTGRTAVDGCVLAKDTISASDDQQNVVMIQQVGKWLGLTRQELGKSDRSSGVACVYNFMNDDALSKKDCKLEFTHDQAELMRASYEYFRQGLFDETVTQLFSGVEVGPMTLEPKSKKYFYLDANATVICAFSSADYKSQVFLKWDQLPAFSTLSDDCHKCAFTGVCTANIFPGDVKIVVGVKGPLNHAVQNFTLMCVNREHQS